MKVLGDILFPVGMVGFFLALSGYDSCPLGCGIAALVLLLVAFIGYRIDGEMVEYEDIVDVNGRRERQWKRRE